ncbi:hypothetical protein [Phytomonospora endophytica]|uniref:LigA protein n=1 Tax=Phytomonospora endophytica TaxID=714109 RepID=A0A841FKD8_9ACTN|nr:hypothetical protein [Phytomonospora endophytica]MBB6032430.1 hypothetical protein [Phytomonospora endophytica]GIG66423.1 hypothetical protein Pen01_27180 [Phytomonospora endophytica]
MSDDTHPSPGSPPPGRTALRVSCAVLVLATLPYLSLKIHWLLGGTAGLNGMADTTQVDALNAFTAGMDLVAALLAGVFAFRRGRRVPAWLILFPVWVGTGLLGEIVLGMPFQALASTVAGEPLLPAADAGAAPPPVASWVFGMVYGGFVVQGLAFLTAFVLYARERWTDVFTGRAGEGQVAVPALRALATPLTWTAAVGAGAVALINTAWALGYTGGISADHVDAISRSARTNGAVIAVFALAAAVGLVLNARTRSGRVPRWTVTLAAWVGTGSMFGWGMWGLLVLLGSDTGVGMQHTPDLTNYEVLLRFTLGILGGTAFLLTQAERELSRSC